jgi:hypothetical protein
MSAETCLQHPVLPIASAVTHRFPHNSNSHSPKLAQLFLLATRKAQHEDDMITGTALSARPLALPYCELECRLCYPIGRSDLLGASCHTILGDFQRAFLLQ